MDKIASYLLAGDAFMTVRPLSAIADRPVEISS